MQEQEARNFGGFFQQGSSTYLLEHLESCFGSCFVCRVYRSPLHINFFPLSFFSVSLSWSAHTILSYCASPHPFFTCLNRCEDVSWFATESSAELVFWNHLTLTIVQGDVQRMMGGKGQLHSIKKKKKEWDKPTKLRNGVSAIASVQRWSEPTVFCHLFWRKYLFKHINSFCHCAWR